MNNPNNLFGISDDAFDAIIASAIIGSAASNMKRPTPGEKTRKLSRQEEAKTAKEIYDSYVAVGFTDTQAFELLKTVLTIKRTLF